MTTFSYYLILHYKTTDQPQTLRYIERVQAYEPDSGNPYGYDPNNPDHIDLFLDNGRRRGADAYDDFLEADLTRIPVLGDVRIVLPSSSKIKYVHPERHHREHIDRVSQVADRADSDDLVVGDVMLALGNPTNRLEAMNTLAILNRIDSEKFPYPSIIVPFTNGNSFTFRSATANHTKSLLELTHQRCLIYSAVQNAQNRVQSGIIANHQAVVAQENIWRDESLPAETRRTAEEAWERAVRVTEDYDSEARFNHFYAEETREYTALIGRRTLPEPQSEGASEEASE